MSNILLSFSGPTPVSGCERCPSGSFSLGGGVSYSSMTNAWSRSLPPAFDTECDSRDANSGVWVNNCLPWASDASGGYVMSGNNSNIASTYNADRLYAILRLTATFVRPGNLTFQFKVDAEPPYDGLIFMIDGIVAMTMVSTTNGWAEVTYGVNPGSHVFVWKYSKNSGGDWGLDQAAIRLIEFTGTRCPPGTISIRSQLYGIITRRGWSLWPAIVDNVTAVRSGWKLTEQGITRDTALNPQWLPIAPLLFSTLHANRGVLEINYTLSGIPTTPGNKAWLELYVNDVQVAIANPSTNGTFLHQSQLSPRLDGNSTLAVLFVWRTGSAAADKASNVLIRSVKLSGTVSGGTSGCGNCPTGYQPTANQTSCGMCPAGSAATILGTQYAPCCPSDTFSYAGAGICSPCGTNTYSVPGSTICRVKQLLMDSDAGVMYNLTALQALVDPLVDLDVASGYLPVSPVNSTTPIVLNATTATLIGVFRPIVPQIPAQYVVASSSLVNTGALLVGSPQSYVIGLAMSNTREAGSSFLYNADRFGLVQCTVPPVRSKITRVANNYGYAKTSIEFICDPAAVSITQPVLVPSSECNYKLTWTTAAACPLCDLPLFTPTKSACSLMGNQTVTYVPAVPCVGGRQPPSLVTVQTCASITLDQQTAGIAAGVVFLILLLIVGLIVGFVVVYRKYKATLLEFMYLKGQVTSHEMLESGSTRSADGAYEFDQKADTLSPEASVVSDEADEEEEVNIKPKANVVM
ncbi:hypothetical protein DYB38_000415 [Aphanomyces astaci]|uniref:MRH domain-containing protein n=1 Tax=Aphanomyces astaci TaxID=112090 RepID=A0A397D3N7_APHAT|nr:hypothetical protein DYB38_000415 [Aphanomyces astaci]